MSRRQRFSSRHHNTEKVDDTRPLKNFQTITYIHDEIQVKGSELMHKNAELVVLTDRLRQPLLEDLEGGDRSAC